ncbi:SF1B family DNA helicase RecD2 [Intestinibacillus sp. Marseille-P6563]|uniref:SF1B family DNA helicase RecD2 n=1 Tax=Intestinibacillus sp. Marseille-P6563 TaxID=2364792 RepID=UPI000F05BB4E|nr:ATP-dependent RecD-like DNA helicase [Intestinibacillus sp. Marseille-P6563]
MQEAQQEYQMVCGTVSQIVFQNEENGYAVLRLIAPDGEEITATGYIPGLGLGEELTLGGRWTTHPSYGEQFTAESFERRLPVSVRGIADYLGSGLIKGIGPRLAVKIAEKFGEDTFDILQNDPAQLTEIRGITTKKAQDIGRQFTEMSEMRLLMDFLTENGLPVWLTPRLYKRLGVAAMDALTENPYLLCDEYYEIDFGLADALALNLGLPRLSEERADAGILYTMTFNLNNGHTFIPVEKLVGAACTLLSDDDVVFEEPRAMESIERLAARGQVVREIIAGRDAVYLRQMYEAEDFLAGCLKQLAAQTYTYDFDLDELLNALEQDADVAYAPLQKKAIATAAKCGVSILTGGPGTGKTTAVRGMLRVFEALGLETVLAAPTGRAAKRLSELCGMEAKTIHRLLEAGYGPGGKLAFQRCLTNPLDCGVVVLDEVSMVDISLMQALLAAMPTGARLVLVGDADQLPPVGPGNFLRDLITSGCVPVTQLTEIFRQAQKSDIVMNAHAINEGRMPVPSGKDGDFFMMKKADPAAALQTVTELCRDRLPRYYGLSPSQIQVLTPSRRQGAGTAQLNRRLQEALNPATPEKNEKRFGDTVFREGDRVMQIRNNYDIVWERMDNHEQGTGMFNGDVGEILQIFPGQECLIVKFDDKLATYTFDMLDELELAYAMTVHKAQGSEFEAVIVALSAGVPRRLLTRNILYTAITRAKKLLVIVGAQETLETMVNTNTRGRRYSALKARMLLEDGR